MFHVSTRRDLMTSYDYGPEYKVCFGISVKLPVVLIVLALCPAAERLPPGCRAVPRWTLTISMCRRSGRLCLSRWWRLWPRQKVRELSWSVRSLITSWWNCQSVCVGPVAGEQISVKVEESGWAWMVCGERVIIWKICQTAVAKVRQYEYLERVGGAYCFCLLSGKSGYDALFCTDGQTMSHIQKILTNTGLFFYFCFIVSTFALR